MDQIGYAYRWCCRSKEPEKLLHHHSPLRLVAKPTRAVGSTRQRRFVPISRCESVERLAKVLRGTLIARTDLSCAVSPVSRQGLFFCSVRKKPLPGAPCKQCDMDLIETISIVPVPQLLRPRDEMIRNGSSKLSMVYEMVPPSA
jgi:hypothetical protein